MSSRMLLTEDQVARARALWAAGEAQADIAAALGVNIDRFKARLRDQLADLPGRPRRVNSGRRGIEPSIEEIAAAAAEIRAGWPEERFLPEPAEQFRTTAF